LISPEQEWDRQECLSHAILSWSNFSEAETRLKLGRAHGAPLLKALAAIHRSSLRRAEWNRRFFSALRAVRFRFRPHGTAPAATLGSLRLAGFATLWFVLEAFVGEKHLFAGSKYELGTTLGTLQDLIVIFHEPLSP
jgi:hypothetical protein